MKKLPYIFVFLVVFALVFNCGRVYGKWTAQRLDYSRSLASAPVLDVARSASSRAAIQVFSHKFDSLVHTATLDTIVYNYLRTVPLCTSIRLDTAAPSMILDKR